ncbi:MAG TPA: M14 family metallopeptidase [Candidatus Brocadiia bacterium]|nr:M14 family metallopeptidase [Candidatus Brocadiia bacterium]
MPAPNIDFSLFYTAAELQRHMASLARWKPEMASLHVIGKSPAGRRILLLEITDPATGPASAKPAFFVHGNIHASEVSGSSSALYLAHYLLAHAQDDDATAALLRGAAFYICPRISVDGAEDALVQGRSVRSRDLPERRKNCIWPEDLDKDGRILQMRLPDPNGEWIAFDSDPSLLLQRLPGDEGGQRYRLTTEGLIHDWDGGPWNNPAGRYLDFNRNWGFNWRPPHQQSGAGRHSFSEPEMRAVADFLFDHTNIFGALGFHTGPAAVLRPPSAGGDSSMEKADLPLFRQLALLGSQITGFPGLAVAEYRSVFHDPSDYHGHFPDFGYKALGLLTFEIELGVLMNSAGCASSDIFKFTPQDLRQAERRLMAWRNAHLEEEVFVDWKPFDHPQLGPVEIGGWLPVGKANICRAQRVETWERARQFIFELARRAPRVEIHGLTAAPLGNGLFKVTCNVANDGFLSTSVTHAGINVQGVEGVIVEVERPPGVEFISGRNYTRLGHMAASSRQEMQWVLRCPARKRAKIDIIARAARAGQAAAAITLAG